MLLFLRPVCSCCQVQAAEWVSRQYSLYYPAPSELKSLFEHCKQLYPEGGFEALTAQEGREMGLNTTLQASRHGPDRLGLGLGAGAVRHSDFDSPSYSLSHFGARGIKTYLGDFAESLIVQDLPDHTALQTDTAGRGFFIRPLLWVCTSLFPAHLTTHAAT